MFRRVGGSLVLALALTSCINLDVDVTIDGDGLATGSYEVRVSKEAAALVGVSSPEDLERQLVEGEGGILPKGNRIEVGERDGFYTLKATLAAVPLTEDGFRAVKLESDNVRFEFRNDVSEEEAESFGASSVGTITLRVVMPGKIVASDGFEIRGERVVDYSGAVSEPVVLFVESESGAAGGSWPVMLIVAGVIAGIISIGLIRNGKRSSGSPSTDTPQE